MVSVLFYCYISKVPEGRHTVIFFSLGGIYSNERSYQTKISPLPGFRFPKPKILRVYAWTGRSRSWICEWEESLAQNVPEVGASYFRHLSLVGTPTFRICLSSEVIRPKENAVWYWGRVRSELKALGFSASVRILMPRFQKHQRARHPIKGLCTLEPQTFYKW